MSLPNRFPVLNDPDQCAYNIPSLPNFSNSATFIFPIVTGLLSIICERIISCLRSEDDGSFCFRICFLIVDLWRVLLSSAALSWVFFKTLLMGELSKMFVLPPLMQNMIALFFGSFMASKRENISFVESLWGSLISLQVLNRLRKSYEGKDLYSFNNEIHNSMAVYMLAIIWRLLTKWECSESVQNFIKRSMQRELLFTFLMQALILVPYHLSSNIWGETGKNLTRDIFLMGWSLISLSSKKSFSDFLMMAINFYSASLLANTEDLNADYYLLSFLPAIMAGLEAIRLLRQVERKAKESDEFFSKKEISENKMKLTLVPLSKNQISRNEKTQFGFFSNPKKLTLIPFSKNEVSQNEKTQFGFFCNPEKLPLNSAKLPGVIPAPRLQQ